MSVQEVAHILHNQMGKIDDNNSTRNILGNAETYTGSWTNVVHYSQINVLVNTNQTGTLYVDFSIDSIITDRTKSVSVLATGGSVHTFVVISKFVRVRYINDATPQTVFRLQTIYHKYKSKELTSTIEQTIDTATDVQNVRSVIVAQEPDNSYSNVKKSGIAFITTSNLLANITYDSGVISTIGYSQVETHILADQVGTMIVYFYSDLAGTDTVRTLTIPYVIADGYRLFSAPCFSSYIKYTFVNGATNQGDFYFSTKLLTTALNAQILGVDAYVAPNMVAGLNRSVIVAKDLLDNYTNVRSDYNGDLHVAEKANTWQSLSIREIRGDFGVNVIIKPKALLKFGRNTTLGTAFEDVWSTTGTETYAIGNTINEVVSTSASDTGTVVIEGHSIDGSNLTFVVQTITMNGTTPVSLTTSLNRASRIYNNNSVNWVGTITVYESVLGTVHLTGVASINQSEKAGTSFSSVDYGLITQVYGGVNTKTNTICDFYLQIRTFGGVFRSKYNFSATNGTTVINLNPYIVVPANADVKIIAKSSTTNTDVSAGFNCCIGLVQ